MRKRILSLFLAIILCLGMMGGMAAATAPVRAETESPLDTGDIVIGEEPALESGAAQTFAKYD